MCELLPRSAFLHIPKAGGTWVREVLRESGLSRGVLYSSTPEESSEGISPSWHCVPESREEYQQSQFKFAFVRHPLTWYQSYWSFRVGKDNWNEYNPLDKFCAANTFEDFIDNVLRVFTKGYLGGLYWFYIKNADFVGNIEDGWPALLDILMRTGDYWLVDYIKKLPPQNTSDKTNAVYRNDQIERVIQLEQGIIEEFYPHG